MPGRRFGVFGRAVGAKLIRAGDARGGSALLLTPVNSVRYWEFDFVDRHLPRSGSEALDVSSPRILSLYLAHHGRFARIVVSNPDGTDLSETRKLVNACRLRRIETRLGNAVEVTALPAAYDSIWSVSVVEHIPGENSDAQAVSAMYRALKPGGTLAITVPTDRYFWNEYRRDDLYGLGLAPEEDGSHFFQRYYDLEAIEARIIDRVGTRPTAIEWFGERQAGIFSRYERDWMKTGHRATVGDPALIAKHFRTYPTWQDMPGMGVCGLVFTAPSLAPSHPAGDVTT